MENTVRNNGSRNNGSRHSGSIFSAFRRHAALVMGVTSVAFALLMGVSATAQQPDGSFTNPSRFVPRDGAVLYRTSCQACHMSDGQGASGAASYPALAKNQKLRTARYPVFVVTNGQKAMPPFGPMLDDEQVAAVVNYIRTNLGNGYSDPVTAADVKAIRK
jgi:mono/diheme cytochrome c family protein